MKMKKNKMKVIIYTSTHRIEGTYHAIPGGRVLDDLNARKEFIPVTQATVAEFGDENGVSMECELCAVSKSSITLFVPRQPEEVAEGPKVWVLGGDQLQSRDPDKVGQAAVQEDLDGAVVLGAGRTLASSKTAGPSGQSRPE
ncbi:MAG: hypothetical protein HY334_08710 [Armatimonadetes bacterium]|nr:hypothetical protein [Armatimonadota bacterium]